MQKTEERKLVLLQFEANFIHPLKFPTLHSLHEERLKSGKDFEVRLKVTTKSVFEITPNVSSDGHTF